MSKKCSTATDTRRKPLRLLLPFQVRHARVCAWRYGGCMMPYSTLLTQGSQHQLTPHTAGSAIKAGARDLSYLLLSAHDRHRPDVCIAKQQHPRCIKSAHAQHCTAQTQIMKNVRSADTWRPLPQRVPERKNQHCTQRAIVQPASALPANNHCQHADPTACRTTQLTPLAAELSWCSHTKSN